jgi:hypothetical protein
LVSYPVLTPQQQKGLPALIKPVQQLPQQFEDSSHQVWVCQTADEYLVLKTCNHDSIRHSAFWQGMECLFDIGFPTSLGESEQTYLYLAEHGHFKIPEHISSDSESYVLVKFLEGKDLDANAVQDHWVIELAQQLSQLHSQTHSSWGSLSNPCFQVDQWSERLVITLTALAEQQMVDQKIVQQAIEQAEAIETTCFVPIMPDFRWDQCRQLDDGRIALLDLDAFVIGSKELELILLEYILDKRQAQLFEQHYQHKIDWTELNNVRIAYRLLLFLMNVLGEQDIEKWMSAPSRF